MPRQENIDALQGAMLRFRVRDLEGYLAIYSPSVIHHGFSSRIRPGLTGLKDHYSALLNGFPDMRVEIDDIIADGEKVAASFVERSWAGAPRTVARVTWQLPGAAS